MRISRQVLRQRKWPVVSEKAQHEIEQVAIKQVAIGALLLVLNDDAVCSRRSLSHGIHYTMMGMVQTSGCETVHSPHACIVRTALLSMDAGQHCVASLTTSLFEYLLA
jgi:hypothetical protein